MILNQFKKVQVLILCLGLFSSCFNLKKTEHIIGKTMGTTFSIKYIPIDSTPKREKLSILINRKLIEINNEMSTYQKDSEISLFNNLEKGKWMKISMDFFFVLSYSLELAKKTKGIFDPTIGPLVNLWGFGPSGERRVPTKKQIGQMKTKVGFNKLEINQSNSSIKKKVQGLKIDLSAVAKGLGVDKIGFLLESFDIRNYMVEIGGEIRVRGKKNEGPWILGIETPHSSEIQKVLKFRDRGAIATSGNYRNFFKEKGRYYSHTINYHTGAPVENRLLSVTVTDLDSTMKADALATALMAMGLAAASAYAKSNKISAYFIYLKESVGQGQKKIGSKGSKLFNQQFEQGNQK